MKSGISKKVIEELVKTSLEIALKEYEVVFEGYFYEETLRYIVANQINKMLSKHKKMVSFPNKTDNEYKLVFQCSYTDNKKDFKRNKRTDMAIIRSSAMKFNDSKHSDFYKKVYYNSISNNKGFIINSEVLSFDTEKNSFVIYSDLDKNNKYQNSKNISDKEAYEKYQAYKANVGKKPKVEDLENQGEYNGNLMVIELKKFSTIREIEQDVKRLKGMLDSSEGFECFNFGVFINFGFINDETKNKFVEYLKGEIRDRGNLLIAYLDVNENKGVKMKWIN